MAARRTSTTRPASTRSAKALGVLDLDALEVEASGRPFQFKLGGEKFTLPPGSELDWRTGEALEDGRYGEALEMLLGEKQYATFTNHALSAVKLSKLIEAYWKHIGIAPGESEASAAS